MKRKLYTLLFIWCLGIGIVQSQSGFSLRNMAKVEIPFEYKNNLIIIDVNFQGYLPLKFIFDTGAEHTIISKREITDLLKIPYRKEFKIIGSDMSTEITAFLITGIQLQIADLLLPNRSMLVLDKDHLHLEEVAGVKIHGILGSDIFKRYVVRINYYKKVITFYRAEAFKLPNKGFEKIELEIFKNKPYIKEKVFLSTQDSLPIKLLVDSGAALSLLLHTNSHPQLTIPENAVNGKLAFGLGGFIEGYLGRVRQLEIGKNFRLNEVLTNFQDLHPGLDTSFLNQRNGLLGNQALSRFDVIIHYPFEELYLRPNKTYRNTFEFDKSGLIIIATGENLTSFSIHEIIENSPAFEMGLQKGDIIKSINLIPSGFLTLKEIGDILKRKEGRRIRLVIKRDKKRMIFKFRLRKLI